MQMTIRPFHEFQVGRFTLSTNELSGTLEIRHHKNTAVHESLTLIPEEEIDFLIFGLEQAKKRFK